MISKEKKVFRNDSIVNLYQYFTTNVVQDFTKVEANEMVSIFSFIMKNNDISNYTKKETLNINGSSIKVNIENLNLFLNSITDSNQIIKLIDINSDRLIEDTTRRFKGEFYTPTAWVNESHKMISEIFGYNWKENYVVWDCSSGTNNLTRDFNFKNLFCSTLNKSDLDMTKNINKESTKFQYDFLNDDINETGYINENEFKIPKSLYLSLKENKPILFFINPPYATGSNGKSSKNKSKDGTGDTKICSIMKKNKVGASSQQLYAQFLYRIMLIKEQFNLTDINIAIYSPSLFLSGPSYKGFRNDFLNNFEFKNGMLFNAKHFSDVKSNWAIDFSIWKTGETFDKENFIHSIKELNSRGEIVSIGEKNIYNLDNSKSASNWIKNSKNANTIETISLKSAINLGSKLIKINKDDLGFFINDSNNVYANTQGVYLMSSKVTRHVKTIPITKDNFEDCCSLFTARKIIKSNWINQKDEYMIPNKNHISYKEWELDSIIYSIFNNSSNQTSLRNIEFKEKQYDIKNEMFFMSKEEIKGLAVKNNNIDILADLENSKDRFLFNYIKDKTLSKEAQDVLNCAKKIIELSFSYRNEFNKQNPKYNINTWDAGWYQVKNMVKDLDREKLLKFNEVYQKLEFKLLNQVYELGFIK